MVKAFLNIGCFYRFGTVPVLVKGLGVEQVLKLPIKNRL